MLIIQAFLICILLTTIVKIAVGNDAVNGAYFYPKEIQQRLIESGARIRRPSAGNARSV
ncbi:MAG: hypothetical protein ACLTAX_01285 [Waltera sp.]